MHFLKTKLGSEAFMGIKLDMSKAYDRIEWTFLHKVLKAHGFSDKFVSMVMFCISTISFSVRLNEGPLPDFKPNCGLRQGDPLSPYLFILCSKVLSKLLLHEESRGTISRIKITNRCLSINHLMYANDTFIFCKADTSQARIFKGIIRQYCNWSG